MYVYQRLATINMFMGDAKRAVLASITIFSNETISMFPLVCFYEMTMSHRNVRRLIEMKEVYGSKN